MGPELRDDVGFLSICEWLCLHPSVTLCFYSCWLLPCRGWWETAFSFSLCVSVNTARNDNKSSSILIFCAQRQKHDPESMLRFMIIISSVQVWGLPVCPSSQTLRKSIHKESLLCVIICIFWPPKAKCQHNNIYYHSQAEMTLCICCTVCAVCDFLMPGIDEQKCKELNCVFTL